MNPRKKWLIIGCIAIACLLFAGAFIWYQHRSSLTLTAQATLYVPSDDAHYKSENVVYKSYRFFPNQNGSAGDDLPDHTAVFRQGVLNTDFYYGTKFIVGSFPLSELITHWEDIPLEEDWPFYIQLFNTNEERAFKAHLELEIYKDKMRANATLYFYYKHKAYEIQYWTGEIGEEIRFNCEL